MTDTDTIEYRTRQLAEARPNPACSNPKIRVSGPEGQTNWLSITPAEYFRVVEALTTEPPITYRVQPHDINTLTWPMWDACGIECPAMIGAECPAIKAHLRQTCPGKSSKWSNAATEVVYGWTMGSMQSETCGDVDQLIGCNHLFRNPDAGEHDGPMGAGLILHTDSQGNVDLTRYTTVLELESDWQQLQDKEAEYDRANCEDCTDDERCCAHDDDDDVPEYERHEPHRFDDGTVVPEGDES